MNNILIALILVGFTMQEPFEKIDFGPESNLRAWTIVDDVVMGGRSDGSMYINKDGHAEFTGTVSLENNGGFSSIRHRMNPQSVEPASYFNIHLKGDGKNYQFRVKSSGDNWYTYVYEFQTSGDWQTVRIPMRDMYPSFRGRILDFPNYAGNQVSEIGFLIANKRNETFKLLIDYIDIE